MRPAPGILSPWRIIFGVIEQGRGELMEKREVMARWMLEVDHSLEEIAHTISYLDLPHEAKSSPTILLQNLGRMRRLQLEMDLLNAREKESA
jgi:hypothetical protein